MVVGLPKVVLRRSTRIDYVFQEFYNAYGWS
jgi:hypothetical protein